MELLKERWRGLALCLAIAVPAAYLGNRFPIIGGPVIAIIAGMIMTQILKDKTKMQPGITFTSKKILQYAVILLGFGLNLSVIFQTVSYTHLMCIRDRDKIIACYSGSIESAEILKSLESLVPKYMFPNIFYKLKALPRSANGKVDRPELKKRYLSGESS